eukprot:CAMPEP_0179238904 /NCGR_PEP_ID=MMETSP0797-20121207/15191_1 /TAXON_ID=47934 /ORGANISM="Dinophysis acuminata, Strain DAEP01" /LENGTH=504 /DNA_ID=CAMNT_0020946221 /DNA_START=35 /DNA_END=1549 /DNA_ORIENTATION=-
MPASDAKDRVVALLKQLDGEAGELEQEAQALHAERSQWSPATLPKYDKSATLPPQKHAQRLVEAAFYEERKREMSRKADKFRKEADTWDAHRADAARSAEEAVRAGGEQQRQAEQRLKELQAARHRAALGHKRQLSEDEAAHAKRMGALERQIEETRRASEAATAATRQEVTRAQERGRERVDDLHAEFRARNEDLQRDTDQRVAACEAAAAAAEQRKAEAIAAAGKAWDDCEEKMRAANADANSQAQALESSRNEIIASTNDRLAELDGQLSDDLAASAARERAMRGDRAAEERCQAVEERTAEETRRRRGASEALATRCRDETARLAQEALAAGRDAIEQAEEARRKADQEIEETLADLDQHTITLHQGKIKELHAKLNAAVQATRDGLQEVIGRFEREAQLRADETGQAFVEADRRVEEIREGARGNADAHASTVEQAIQKINADHHHGSAETYVKFRQTQDQMVKYLELQHKEMVDYLQQPDTLDMPLQLRLLSESPASS